MEFIYNDGGRQEAGYKSHASDCVVRSIAIATNQPYKKVYDDMNKFIQTNERRRIKGKKSTSRNGVYRDTLKKYLTKLGCTWVPIMGIGTGCRVHLRANELPKGRLIVSVSKHMVAVIDGVIHDTHDCSRGGERCVYGYYIVPSKQSKQKLTK